MRYISLVLLLLILSSSCADKDKKVDTIIRIESEFIEENVKWFNN
ncbi:hypothetical protein [Aquimarina sp. LLG6339-5]